MLVCIDGIIGIGKTTLLDELYSRGHVVMTEDVGEWAPYLAAFYDDPKRNCFALQMKVLHSLGGRKIPADHDRKLVFVERSPRSSALFSTHAYNLGLMTTLEFDLFMRFYSTLNPWMPDRVVLLQVPAAECVERIATRARSTGEVMAVDEDYLNGLEQVYERYYDRDVIVMDGTRPTIAIADDLLQLL